MDEGTKRQKMEDADQLFAARLVLENPIEQSDNGPLYKWAKLVTERHAAGHSIAKADDWLGQLMAGMSPEDL